MSSVSAELHVRGRLGGVALIPAAIASGVAAVAPAQPCAALAVPLRARAVAASSARAVAAASVTVSVTAAAAKRVDTVHRRSRRH